MKIFRNINEIIGVFLRTGHVVEMVNHPKNPVFFGKHEWVGSNKHIGRITLFDPPTDIRNDIIFHECMHHNSHYLTRGKGWPDHIYQEAIDIVAQYDEGEKMKSEYSEKEWGEESLVRLACDFRHLSPRERKELVPSRELRGILFRMMLPDAGGYLKAAVFAAGLIVLIAGNALASQHVERQSADGSESWSWYTCELHPRHGWITYEVGSGSDIQKMRDRLTSDLTYLPEISPPCPVVADMCAGRPAGAVTVTKWRAGERSRWADPIPAAHQFPGRYVVTC